MWTKVAIPSILYGVECTKLSKKTWIKLESVNCLIGKFMLNLQSNTQNVAAFVSTDLVPLKFMLMDRLYSTVSRFYDSGSSIIEECMILAESQGDKSLLYSQYSELFVDWDVNELYSMFRERKLKNYMNEQLQEVSTTTFFFIPWRSIDLNQKPYSEIGEDEREVLYQFLFCNAQLGNRAPTQQGISFKQCMFCKIDGNDKKMDEIHLILECPRYQQEKQE